MFQIFSILLLIPFCFAYSNGDVLILDRSNISMISNGENWMIKFYAPWCGHCRNFAPVWKEIAKELEGETNIAKVNGDDNPDLAARFFVKGYPTLVHVVRGKITRNYEGSRKKAAVLEYARGGYAQQAANGFFTNPLSLFGVALSWVTYVGWKVRELQEYLTSEHALPMPLLIVGGTAALLVVSLLSAVIIVWILSCFDKPPPNQKKNQ